MASGGQKKTKSADCKEEYYDCDSEVDVLDVKKSTVSTVPDLQQITKSLEDPRAFHDELREIVSTTKNLLCKFDSAFKGTLRKKGRKKFQRAKCNAVSESEPSNRSTNTFCMQIQLPPKPFDGNNVCCHRPGHNPSPAMTLMAPEPARTSVSSNQMPTKKCTCRNRQLQMQNYAGIQQPNSVEQSNQPYLNDATRQPEIVTNDNYEESSPAPPSSQTEECPSISQANSTPLYSYMPAQPTNVSLFMDLNTFTQSMQMAQQYTEGEKSALQQFLPIAVPCANYLPRNSSPPTTAVKRKQKKCNCSVIRSRKERPTVNRLKSYNEEYAYDTEYFSLESSGIEEEQNPCAGRKLKRQTARERDRNAIVIQLLRTLLQVMTEENATGPQVKQVPCFQPSLDMHKPEAKTKCRFSSQQTDETSSVKFKLNAKRSEIEGEWLISATLPGNVNDIKPEKEVSSWQPGTEKITFSMDDDVLGTDIQTSKEIEENNLRHIIDKLDNDDKLEQPNDNLAAENCCEAEQPVATENCLEATEKPLETGKPLQTENCVEAKTTLPTENCAEAKPTLPTENCAEAKAPMATEKCFETEKPKESIKCDDTPNEEFKECTDPDLPEDCNECPDTLTKKLSAEHKICSNEAVNLHGQGDEQDFNCDKEIPTSKASSMCGKGDDIKTDDDDSNHFIGNVSSKSNIEEESSRKNKQKNGKCNCCHCRAMSKNNADCPSKALAPRDKKSEKERKSLELKFFIDSLLCDLHAIEKAQKKRKRSIRKFSNSSQYSGSIYNAKPFRQTNICRPALSVPQSFPVTIKSATPLGNSSLYVKWTIHDCYNIGGYELYVDNYLTNRYFNGNHTAAVVCNVDVNRSLKLVLMAHKKIEEVTEPTNCMALQNLQAGNNRKWIPSVYLYDPHTCA